MITDERMAEIVLANKYSSDPLATYRAIEAEVHAEIRMNIGKYSDIVSDGGFDPRNAAPITPVEQTQCNYCGWQVPLPVDLELAPVTHELPLLQARVEELETQIVSGFYEDEVPQFRQGHPMHELEDIVTAAEVTGYVGRIELYKKMLQKVAAHVRPTCGELYEEINKVLNGEINELP